MIRFGNSNIETIRCRSAYDFTDLQNFVRDEVIPNTTLASKEGYFNLGVYQSLHDMGLLNAATPKDLGGLGFSVSDLIWLVRELAYGSAGVAGTFIGNLLGYSTVLLYAKPQLRKVLVQKTLSQLNLWSFAMTEAEVGSDLINIKTRALRTSDGYLISGEKNFITNAPIAHDFGVFAQTYDAGGKPLGISCFYLSGENPHLSRGPALDKMGWRESQTGALYFNDVFVPFDHILGQEGEGLKILTHCLNRSKALLGAMGVGLSCRAMDLAEERLSSTTRYSKPLLEQASIRHILARLYAEVEAAWLLTCSAATVWDQGLAAVRESSIAKLFSGQVAVKVTSQALELFGARGFLNDYEVSKLWRDAKAIEIVEGPSLVQELLIAKEVLPKTKKKQETKVDPFALTLRDREGAQREGDQVLNSPDLRMSS